MPAEEGGGRCGRFTLKRQRSKKLGEMLKRILEVFEKTGGSRKFTWSCAVRTRSTSWNWYRKLEKEGRGEQVGIESHPIRGGGCVGLLCAYLVLSSLFIYSCDSRGREGIQDVYFPCGGIPLELYLLVLVRVACRSPNCNLQCCWVGEGRLRNRLGSEPDFCEIGKWETGNGK